MPMNDFQWLVGISLYVLIRQLKDKRLWLGADAAILYCAYRYAGIGLFLLAAILAGEFWYRENARRKETKRKGLKESDLQAKWDKASPESRAEWVSKSGCPHDALFTCLSLWNQIPECFRRDIPVRSAEAESRSRPTKALRFRVTEIYEPGFRDAFDESAPNERSDLLFFIFRDQEKDLDEPHIYWHETKAAVDEPRRGLGKAWDALPANYQAALPFMVSSAIEAAFSWERLWSNDWSSKGPLMRILSATNAKVGLVEEFLDEGEADYELLTGGPR